MANWMGPEPFHMNFFFKETTASLCLFLFWVNHISAPGIEDWTVRLDQIQTRKRKKFKPILQVCPFEYFIFCSDLAIKIFRLSIPFRVCSSSLHWYVFVEFLDPVHAKRFYSTYEILAEDVMKAKVIHLRLPLYIICIHFMNLDEKIQIFRKPWAVWVSPSPPPPTKNKTVIIL